VLDDSELLARVEALHGMAAVRPALEDGPACFLVGGAVRDLLLGREPLDVDIAVDGDVEAVAERVAGALGGEVVAHERFGTATVVAGGVDAVNLARTRRETYAAPGALPDVEPAALADDLGRRDFTVNALALRLDGDAAGELVDRHGGRADLDAGLIRVLHERSFADDPTRLLRAVRYAARLGFALDPETERWARAAVDGGALATVSGPRIRDELLDLLAEGEAPTAVALLADLGIALALHPKLHADPDLVARARGAAARSDLRRATGADPALTALAALCVGAAVPAVPAQAADAGSAGERGSVVAGSGVAGGWSPDDSLAAWVDRLGLAAGVRDDVLQAARRGPELAIALREERRPSQLRALLDGEPAEALALALALGAPEEPVADYLTRLRDVSLDITGVDILAAGLPESPALGRALEETLARKLDGEVAGREDELRTALAIARGEA
jgi:tRNA nucleotidyltransferase (CCA-adding enzyme)